MSRSFAPPLRLELKPDRILPLLAALTLAAGIGAFLLLGVIHGHALTALLVLPVALAAAGWAWAGRAPHWDWLGCDSQGQWWVATRDGLRSESRIWIEVGSETRVGFRLVVLVYRHREGRGGGVLWLPWWRLDETDFRRLRVRLRWPAELPGRTTLIERLRALAQRLRSQGSGLRATVPDPPGVAAQRLLHTDPEHVYSEPELEAIEALDPELALRLDRAQAFARRGRCAEGPDPAITDDDAVREAIEDVRRILKQDGGDIEFLGVDGSGVRVRWQGACRGCPQAPFDLENVVGRILRARCPGVERVTAEG